MSVQCTKDYKGPERRGDTSDRRASECLFHEAHSVMIDHIDKKNRLVCTNVELLKTVVESKVPMKLFYATAGGLISLILIILGVQWAAYREVNSIALHHVEVMGKVNNSINEVKFQIQSVQTINRLELDRVASAIQETQVRTDKSLKEIKENINKLNGGSK